MSRARLNLLGALLSSGSLLFSACHKSAPPAPATQASAEQQSLSAQKQNELLQAELRRDASAVAAGDLIAASPALREAAVRTLAHIEDERSLVPLTQALADEAPGVVAWAAFGLGQLCRGHEADLVRRLVLRAASLSLEPPARDRDQALGSLALALGRCASDDAERTLRAWLELPTLAPSAELGLGQVARQRRHLDAASVAALLDSAEQQPDSAALYPIESLPSLGAAARARLLEVAEKALSKPSAGRAFALRALAKGGAEAAPLLGRLLQSDTATDAERADAARALAALGSAGQRELGAALESRARALIDGKAWLSSQHGVVLTLLDVLEPKSAKPAVLAELSTLPLEGEPPPVARRKLMLRCRAAALLADKASASHALLTCDPSEPGKQREGSLALLEVLGRGPLDGARGKRFRELARSSDNVVREAALELLVAHDEVPDVPELLADALGAKSVGVRATAAKVLARYPGRARSGAPAGAQANAPPLEPRVIQALSRQLSEVGKTSNIELSSWLLDAAAALELLGAKPAFERACASSNPTLRLHAERGFAALGEHGRRCPLVPGTESWDKSPPARLRLVFETDAGELTITLWGDSSPFATERLLELARSGFFDGMLIHRVVPGFVVQLGDPDGDGFGGPELPPLRCQLGFAPFVTGSVGVALAGRDSGLSQFFVTLRPAPHLTGDYTLIGQADPGWERVAAGDRVLRVRVVTPGQK